MYHYVECGLPNVYLANGYRFVETPYGRGLVIENVESLHASIAQTIVEAKPFLTGPEIRFIRKYLDLTQDAMGEFIGMQGQSVRRWEKLSRVPKPADRAIRMLFRELSNDSRKPFQELIQQIATSTSKKELNYRYFPNARQEHWRKNCELPA